MEMAKANARGAAFMTGSMICFTLNDACMKALSGEVPLSQAIFLRGIATTLLIFILAIALGGLKLRLPRREWKLIALRSVTEIGSAYFFISAIFNMPFANATAILQVLPLSVTLAGAIFLGEAVGWRRMLAIMIGFSGVLLIVRPGFEGFNTYSLYALAAVVAVTARDLLSRQLSMDVPTLTVAFFNALTVMVVFGFASATITWAPVSPAAWAQLGAASVFIIGGYIFSVSAMRIGEIAVIAPFRYTAMISALLLGLILFGEWPDSLTLIGSGIIAVMGLYTFYRERGMSKQSWSV